MNRTITALRKLFQALYQEAKVWSLQHPGGKRKPTAKAQKVWERLSTTYWWAIEDEDLKNWFPDSDELQIDFSEKNRVLYLPPLEKNADFVPVLSLYCHISDVQTCIRLRVMMLSEYEKEEKTGCKEKDEEEEEEEEEKFNGIGFRMESPESENLIDEKEAIFSVGTQYQNSLDKGNFSTHIQQAFKKEGYSLSQSVTVSVEVKGKKWLIMDKKNNQKYLVIKKEDKLNIYEKNEGLHDFYHAQLIQGFGNRLDRKVLVECPGWLPETQPSFPITADCPVTLVFSLLLTLYGKNYPWDFFHKHHQQLNDLKKYVDKLNKWINWDPSK